MRLSILPFGGESGTPASPSYLVLQSVFDLFNGLVNPLNHPKSAARADK
jgi:hypothetical protein